jgi:hypothetical protein
VTRRCIGLDVHREFAQVAIWQDGHVRRAGRIAATPEGLRLFADSLAPTDEVAIEATCNTHAIAKLLEPRVARVCPMFCVRSGVTDAAVGAGKAIHDQAEDQVQ